LLDNVGPFGVTRKRYIGGDCVIIDSEVLIDCLVFEPAVFEWRLSKKCIAECRNTKTLC
jgi:hypothetical protein